MNHHDASDLWLVWPVIHGSSLQASRPSADSESKLGAGITVLDTN